MMHDKYDIIYIPETDSTNLQSSALLSERQSKLPFVVRTDFQTAGKGQSENRWISGRKLNLLCSITVFPSFLSISNHFYLSKITALVLHDVLKKYVGKSKIKWPNDILVNERKIAGILIENTLQNQQVLSSIIGIGLNVNQRDFPEFTPPATSLFMETGKEFEIAVILREILETFDYWYTLLEDDQWQSIDKAYLSAMYRFNEISAYRVAGHELSGKIVGVEADGHLLVESHDKGLLKFGFKEISFNT